MNGCGNVHVGYPEKLFKLPCVTERIDVAVVRNEQVGIAGTMDSDAPPPSLYVTLQYPCRVGVNSLPLLSCDPIYICTGSVGGKDWPRYMVGWLMNLRSSFCERHQ